MPASGGGRKASMRTPPARAGAARTLRAIPPSTRRRPLTARLLFHGRRALASSPEVQRTRRGAGSAALRCCAIPPRALLCTVRSAPAAHKDPPVRARGAHGESAPLMRTSATRRSCWTPSVDGAIPSD
eukprot:470692-Prorocentrum_minimum.AAC.1